MRRLALDYGYDGGLDRARTFSEAKIADELGVSAIFVAETFGLDALVVLTQFAERTKRVRLGSFIVSIFARSAAATAQGFVSLDIASDGRAIAGIGVGTASMATDWHGVPFDRPAARLADYVAVMRRVFDHAPLTYRGEVLQLESKMRLRESPVQGHLPIALGTMSPGAIRLTAREADMWFPQFIPIGQVSHVIGEFRAAVTAAGRSPGNVEIKSPGLVIATNNVEAITLARAQYNAYAIRHVRAVQKQLGRAGQADLPARIDDLWRSQGSRAAAVLVAQALGSDIDFVGTPEACIDRLEEQAAAGVDLHAVQVDADRPADFERILKKLLG